MPSLETLERFIARVEQNAHTEAIKEFYASNASMQENQSAPRIGRDTLVANERKTLARAKSVQSQCVRPIFQSGSHVVIRWIFDFEWKDNSKTHIEELAYSPQTLKLGRVNQRDDEAALVRIGIDADDVMNRVAVNSFSQSKPLVFLT